jgi:hypothetical protein
MSVFLFGTLQKKPTWYLIAEEDRMILERTQRFMAERMKAAVRAAAADHIFHR